MLSGVEPSYEDMERLDVLGLGYYVGGLGGQWHWNKNGFKYFSDEDLFDIYMSIKKNGHRD